MGPQKRKRCFADDVPQQASSDAAATSAPAQALPLAEDPRSLRLYGFSPVQTKVPPELLKKPPPLLQQYNERQLQNGGIKYPVNVPASTTFEPSSAFFATEHHLYLFYIEKIDDLDFKHRNLTHLKLAESCRRVRLARLCKTSHTWEWVADLEDELLFCHQKVKIAAPLPPFWSTKVPSDDHSSKGEENGTAILEVLLYVNAYPFGRFHLLQLLQKKTSKATENQQKPRFQLVVIKTLSLETLVPTVPWADPQLNSGDGVTDAGRPTSLKCLAMAVEVSSRRFYAFLQIHDLKSKDFIPFIYRYDFTNSEEPFTCLPLKESNCGKGGAPQTLQKLIQTGLKLMHREIAFMTLHSGHLFLGLLECYHDLGKFRVIDLTLASLEWTLTPVRFEHHSLEWHFQRQQVRIECVQSVAGGDTMYLMTVMNTRMRFPRQETLLKNQLWTLHLPTATIRLQNADGLIGALTPAPESQRPEVKCRAMKSYLRRAKWRTFVSKNWYSNYELEPEADFWKHPKRRDALMAAVAASADGGNSSDQVIWTYFDQLFEKEGVLKNFALCCSATELWAVNLSEMQYFFNPVQTSTASAIIPYKSVAKRLSLEPKLTLFCVPLVVPNLISMTLQVALEDHSLTDRFEQWLQRHQPSSQEPEKMEMAIKEEETSFGTDKPRRSVRLEQSQQPSPPPPLSLREGNLAIIKEYSDLQGIDLPHIMSNDNN